MGCMGWVENLGCFLRVQEIFDLMIFYVDCVDLQRVGSVNKVGFFVGMVFFCLFLYGCKVFQGVDEG